MFHFGNFVSSLFSSSYCIVISISKIDFGTSFPKLRSSKLALQNAGISEMIDSVQFLEQFLAFKIGIINERFVRTWLYEACWLGANSFTTWYQLGIIWKMLKHVSSMPTRFQPRKDGECIHQTTAVFEATNDCFVDNISAAII